MAATGERRDPFRGFNFRVEVDGITRAGFQEASGLDSTQEPVDYREGDEKKLTARKLPGLNKYSNITLKRGITDDAELFAWRKKGADGTVERKNGSIVLCNETGEEKVRWNFVEGWPSKWTGPSFNAKTNDVAIETLEITHEGIERA
jgi:phage tail-like protein